MKAKKLLRDIFLGLNVALATPSLELPSSKVPLEYRINNIDNKCEESHQHLHLGNEINNNGSASNDAIAEYTKAAELGCPRSISYALLFRGMNWRDKGDLDRALKDYNEGVRLTTNELVKSNAYQLICDVWMVKGNSTEALRYCNQAIEVSPINSSAYMQRGEIFLGEGNLDAAIENFNKSVYLHQIYFDQRTAGFDSDKLRKQKSEFLALAYHYLESAWALNGNLGKAIEYHNKAKRLVPQLSEKFSNPVGLFMLRSTFEKRNMGGLFGSGEFKFDFEK